MRAIKRWFTMCSLDRNMKYLVKGLRSPSGPLQYFFIFQLGKKKKKFMPYNYQHRYFFSEYPCFLTELEHRAPQNHDYVSSPKEGFKDSASC